MTGEIRAELDNGLHAITYAEQCAQEKNYTEKFIVVESITIYETHLSLKHPDSS